jgi:hypothetical protein
MKFTRSQTDGEAFKWESLGAVAPGPPQNRNKSLDFVEALFFTKIRKY